MPERVERATTIGEAVHFDWWSCSQGERAFGTQWTCIMGAVDEAESLVGASGCVTPTGHIAASFVEVVILTYRTRYRTVLQLVRFDNASVYHCELVLGVLAKHKVSYEFSAPYFHGQIIIERYWKTMARCAAAMLYSAQRGKGFYVHACLMKLNMITALGRSRSDPTKTRWEVATGRRFNDAVVRIFGAAFYGYMPNEQRKQLHLGKSDPRAIDGVYVGFELNRPCMLCATLW